MSPDAPRARFAELFRGPLGVDDGVLSVELDALCSGAVGSSRSRAAVATAVLFAGGAVGRIAGDRLADRIGVLAVATLATLAFPRVAALGALGEKSELLLPVSFLAGCFAMGGQTCLHGVVGSLYGTNIRANGVGWAIGINKIGSIAGPFIGGLLLPRLPSGELFLAAASPLLIVATLALVLKLFLTASQSDRSRSGVKRARNARYELFSS